MFNPRNNSPFGGGRGGFGRGAFASRYQYQPMPHGAENAQAGSLVSKVMGLLAFSFLVAFIGGIVGLAIHLTYNTYWIVAIGGFIVLFALMFAINKPGLNLFLLYLFTFLEGLSLSAHWAVPGCWLQLYPGRGFLDYGCYLAWPGRLCLDYQARFLRPGWEALLRRNSAPGSKPGQHLFPQHVFCIPDLCRWRRHLLGVYSVLRAARQIHG